MLICKQCLTFFLSQVKIWFQNRRAKERKINKKKLQQPASSTTTPTPPTGSNGSGGGGGGNGLHANGSSNVAMVTSSSGSNGLVSPSLALNIKEEYWGRCFIGHWLRGCGLKILNYRLRHSSCTLLFAFLKLKFTENQRNLNETCC